MDDHGADHPPFVSWLPNARLVFQVDQLNLFPHIWAAASIAGLVNGDAHPDVAGCHAQPPHLRVVLDGHVQAPDGTCTRHGFLGSLISNLTEPAKAGACS